jgi:hypothetical protein
MRGVSPNPVHKLIDLKSAEWSGSLALVRIRCEDGKRKSGV